MSEPATTVRYVQLFEHERVSVVDPAEGAVGKFLTRAEAEQLLQLNETRRGFCQPVPGGVKFAQHCGVVALKGCVIEVLPKIGFSANDDPDEASAARAALLSMLRSARRLNVTSMPFVGQTSVDAPLLDVFVQAFLRCALEQARRGVLSRYVGHSDDLPAIRGRLAVQVQLRRNLTRPHLMHCEYDEFTADNPHNRAIVAALHACRLWAVHPRTRQLHAETSTRYAAVSRVRMGVRDVQRLPRERATRRYEAVLRWCEWILAMASPAMGRGGHDAPGLLFDMNKLFEAHVGCLEMDRAGAFDEVKLQGPQRPLVGQGALGCFVLKPDITVWQRQPGANALLRIVDAKWKRLDLSAPDWSVDPADLYQLLAYAVRYECRHVELAYPTSSNDGTTTRVFEIRQCGEQRDVCTVTVRRVQVVGCVPARSTESE